MLLNQLSPSAKPRNIENLFVDSRIKSPQGLYFAIKGFVHDGHKFIPQAIENGAVAIVHSDPITNPVPDIEYIKVDDVRQALQKMSSVFYNHPEDLLCIHAITGTNGKTTIAKTLYNLTRQLGVNAGYIGTLSIEYSNVKQPSILTTPDILDLKKLYHDMVKAGVTIVFQEISSHGLSLRRVEPKNFISKSFTNLSHDHLDYHHNMEEYFDAKRLLFNDNHNTPCFINIDDPYGQHLSQTLDESQSQIITYGIDNESDYHATDIKLFPNETHFKLHYKGHTYDVRTPFDAKFNVYNILNVIALLHTCHYIPIRQIIPLLNNIPSVDGRMNFINEGQPYTVLVDYAHSPDSVEKVLSYLKSIMDPENELIVVSGSAGGRDKDKRPVIGQLMTQYGDLAIFTEDDPRQEDVKDIISQMSSGVVHHNWLSIVSRSSAISYTLKYAKPGDVVAILGKGTDTYMQRATGSIPWMSDTDFVKQYFLSVKYNAMKLI